LNAIGPAPPDARPIAGYNKVLSVSRATDSRKLQRITRPSAWMSAAHRKHGIGVRLYVDFSDTLTPRPSTVSAQAIHTEFVLTAPSGRDQRGCDHWFFS
jgi:hypothetical protein